MRKPIIAGNWKMNNNMEQSLALINELKPMVKEAKCEVVVCPPHVQLNEIGKAVNGSNIKLGAQNMGFEESGAFTGEVSVQMLKELGVSYVILGHSERRRHFSETDEIINRKTKLAFKYDLTPIVCCGETILERESGLMKEILGRQIKIGLRNLEKEEIESLVVAYEPVWAIGTGKTASDDQANAAISYIRALIAGMYGSRISEKVRIQYGGSVKPSTIKAQMEQPEIDGALVGGASLKAEDFAGIVNYM
ncbi:MAG: triose-phosphate isomerase [Bacteroidales bacterium]